MTSLSIRRSRACRPGLRASFTRIALVTSLMATMAVTLTACSSSSPSLYTLAPTAGTIQPAPVGIIMATNLPRVVEVRKPTIAGALDRDRIVLNDSSYKLKLSATDSWSEPLSDQIPHVLATDISRRLPGVSLFVQDDATATTPQAYVELVITRFARDDANNAVFEAQVAVHRADSEAPKTSRSILLKMPAPGDTDALVSALSTLLGQAADQIAAEIQQLPPVPTADQ
ncbi:hypothetical protein GOB90_06360 [Acetobacter oeni]|nr:hypothetical protein [Acetobacter oeni]